MGDKQKSELFPNGFSLDQPVHVEGYHILDDGSEELCRRLGGRVVGGCEKYAGDDRAVTVQLNEPIWNKGFAIRHPVTFFPEPEWIQLDSDTKAQLRYQVVPDVSATPDMG